MLSPPLPPHGVSLHPDAHTESRWQTVNDEIRYVQVHNVTSLAVRKNMGTSNGVIDSVLLEAGQPGGDIVGENVVYLELGVDWTSLRSKVGK